MSKGYLYAIQVVGLPYIKIGSTSGLPAKRLKSLQTGQPLPLTLLAFTYIDTDVQAIEKYVHAFLQEKKHHGEWFAIDIQNTQSLEQLIVEAIQTREVHGKVPQERQHEDWPIFRERLLIARQRRQWTQQELAMQTGLFLTDISKYERGQSMPTLPRLVRLALALGCTADYLLGLGDVTDGKSPGEAINELRALVGHHFNGDEKGDENHGER